MLLNPELVVFSRQQLLAMNAPKAHCSHAVPGCTQWQTAEHRWVTTVCTPPLHSVVLHVLLLLMCVQAMKFAKDSRHECSISVMQVKGVTRPVTGGSLMISQ